MSYSAAASAPKASAAAFMGEVVRKMEAMTVVVKVLMALVIGVVTQAQLERAEMALVTWVELEVKGMKEAVASWVLLRSP